MACVPTAQLPRLGRACLLPFGFQNGSGLALPPKTHTRGESAKRWGVWVPSSWQMGHIHFARETFGSLGASSEAPTSVRPVPSQKEGREEVSDAVIHPAGKRQKTHTQAPTHASKARMASLISRCVCVC